MYSWGDLVAQTCAPTKPFLKWTGGKRSIIKIIESHIPSYSGKYYEPFIGGGALYFDTIRRLSVISDINSDLINAYNVVKYHPEELISVIDSFPATSEDVYYSKRKEYNNLLSKLYKYKQLSLDDSISLAALCIWINHTCFNGKYQTDLSGKFLSDYNKVDNKKLLGASLHIRECYKALKYAEIYNSDFEPIIEKTTRGDFVYADPPYVMLKHKTKYISMSHTPFYGSYEFRMSDQTRLANIVKRKYSEGVSFILSNHDTKEIRALYSEYPFDSIPVNRLFTSHGESRKPVNELLIYMLH